MCLLETCFRAGTHACLAPTSVRKKEPAGNKGRIILRSDKKARRGGNPCAMYCGNPTGRPAKAKHRKAAELLEGRPPSDHAAPLPPSLFGDGRTDEVCACMATCQHRTTCACTRASGLAHHDRACGFSSRVRCSALLASFLDMDCQPCPPCDIRAGVSQL